MFVVYEVELTNNMLIQDTDVAADQSHGLYIAYTNISYIYVCNKCVQYHTSYLLTFKDPHGIHEAGEPTHCLTRGNELNPSCIPLHTDPCIDQVNSTVR